MLFCGSNTSTNVRHWYERPWSEVQTVSECLLSQLHRWLHWHLRGWEEAFQRLMFARYTSHWCVVQWFERGRCLSFVCNKQFALSAICPGFYFLSPQPLKLCRHTKHRPTASGLSCRIHSQCNLRHTNSQHTVSGDCSSALAQPLRSLQNQTFLEVCEPPAH